MDVGKLDATSYMNYLSTQNTGSAKLGGQLEGADYSNATDAELMNVCKQFESYFLEQVMKSMEKTVDCFKDESSKSNYSNSMLDFFGDETRQTIAAASTETNSLGLAQTLFEQMKRNYNL